MEWSFSDFAELSGRNHIREWLDDLDDPDQAIIDHRLLQMAAMQRWPEKWASKYRSSGDIYEFRLKGSVQLRPLGTYFGKRRYILLNGAIEKGDKLQPTSALETANERRKKVKRDARHAVDHEFDAPDDMEEDEEEELS